MNCDCISGLGAVGEIPIVGPFVMTTVLNRKDEEGNILCIRVHYMNGKHEKTVIEPCGEAYQVAPVAAKRESPYEEIYPMSKEEVARIEKLIGVSKKTILDETEKELFRKIEKAFIQGRFKEASLFVKEFKFRKNL